MRTMSHRPLTQERRHGRSSDTFVSLCRLLDATRRDSESVDFYRFTSAISTLPEEEKIEIIRLV